MTHTVFTLHPSSFEEAQRALIKIGIPCPKGKWFVGDAIKPEGQGLTFLSSYIQAQQLWQDGSIKWLYLEALVEPINAPSRDNVPINLRKCPSAFSPRPSPVVDKSDCFVIQLNNQSTICIDKKAFLSLDLGSLRSHFYQQTCDAEIKVVDNHYELLSDMSSYQQVKITQSALVTYNKSKSLCLEAEYTLHLVDGSVFGRVTLTNPAPASHPGGKWDLGDPFSLHIEECGLRLQGNQTTALMLDSQYFSLNAKQTLSVFQASSGHQNWDSPVHVNAQNRVPHSIRGYVLKRDSERIGSGKQCNPILKFYDKNESYFVKTHQFWQNFPASIVAAPEHTDISFLGSRYAEAIELQPGEQKTREFSIAASPTAPATLTLSAQWVKETQVLPFFTDVASIFQPLINQGIEGPFSFFNKRVVIDEFGWRHFGELYADHESALSESQHPFVSHYNNQYDPVYGMLQQWLLTGDPRWFELADDLARHVADIDVYHTQLDKPEYSGGLFWHTDHYVQAYTATHRTYSKRQPADVYDDHAGGGGPGGQHCYTNGLTLHYLLTGYTPSKNAVSSMANWIERYYEGDNTLVGALLAFRNSNTPGLKNIKTGQYPLDRGTGNYLQALLDRFSLFGQLEDIKQAGDVIAHTISPFDDIHKRHFEDVESTWFYTVFLQALCRFIDVKVQLEQRDSDYRYAIEGLKHYAKWMIDNEYTYLDKPDILEFPNQTWSGQDLRKLCVLHFASAYLTVPQRTQCIEKIDEISSNIIHRLGHSEETTNTRILCLMMQNAHFHGFTPRESGAPTSVPFAETEDDIKKAEYSLSRHLIKLLMSFSISRERSQLIKRFPVCQKWLGKP